MKDKICIVTGANSGIGKATATELALKGARVIMVCRNKEKGMLALEEIKKISKNDTVELMIADLSSQKEIRQLAEKIRKKYPVIHVLINNAGAVNDKWSETVDKIETTFATNHLAYFLLTLLILDNLKSAPNARIINLASEAQRTGKINFEDLNLKNEFSAFKTYSQSKLANVMFTYELARRLKDTNVTVNCMHPGLVRTNFGKDLSGFFKGIIILMKPFMRNSEKAAETVIWLASSPDVEGISGKYYSDKKEIKSNSISYDLQVSKKLWEESEGMTGLTKK
jgi:NAD(P)-dependent dehydrogenase (short-subunit alcohol dehydrogenase family)